MSYFKNIYSGDIDAEKLGLNKEMIKLLYEIGVTGIWLNEIADARVIFDGLKALRPQNELPVLGLALIAFAEGNLDKSIEMIVKEALVINPRNDIVKAYLALAIQAKGGLEGEYTEICENIISHNEDKTAVTLAKSILEQRQGTQ